jgi:hypothetical protein
MGRTSLIVGDRLRCRDRRGDWCLRPTTRTIRQVLRGAIETAAQMLPRGAMVAGSGDKECSPATTGGFGLVTDTYACKVSVRTRTSRSSSMSDVRLIQARDQAHDKSKET